MQVTPTAVKLRSYVLPYKGTVLDAANAAGADAALVDQAHILKSLFHSAFFIVAALERWLLRMCVDVCNWCGAVRGLMM